MREPNDSSSRLPTDWIKAVAEARKRSLSERPAFPEPNPPATVPEESYDHAAELQALIDRLKQERILRGLSLGDVARQTQQARSAVSRLESGEYVNPTLHTLYRYARALGCHIRLCAEPIPDGTRVVDQPRETRGR